MPDETRYPFQQLNADIGREISNLRAVVEQIRLEAVKRLDKHADTLEVVGRALDLLSMEHRRMTTQIDRLLTGPEPLEVRLANLSHQVLDTGRQCVSELANVRAQLIDLNARRESLADTMQNRLMKEIQSREEQNNSLRQNIGEDIKGLRTRIESLEHFKTQAFTIISVVMFIFVILQIVIKLWP